MTAIAKSDFEVLRERYLPKIEKHIERYLNNISDASSEMTWYHFQTGGKRLRALIPLYVYHAFEHDPANAIALGAAVEMIHNATLVHDDLQDGDEYRRGKMTVWKKYSMPQAINCGDAMFHYAVGLLLQMQPLLSADRLFRLIDRATKATLYVIEGQSQEFRMKDEAYPGVQRYIRVIRGKTSGLFALPIVGALEALGIDENICLTAENLAMDLGMLFQIQDDLLDVYGMKGRDKAATDIAEGKVSIFVAHVNDVGTAEEKEKLNRILKKPREKTTNEDIQVALEIFDRTEAKAMAVGVIRAIQKSLHEDQTLKSVPELRNLLIELSEQFLEPVNGIL